MKEYDAKTVAEAVKKAAAELNIPEADLKYEVISEVKGLFKKSAKIGVYEKEDANAYAEKYLAAVLDAMGLKAELAITVTDDIIHLDMTSESDANRIIGRGGETLRALNELVRAALFNKFGEHYRILLNINGYKDQKYEKLVAMAKRIACTVRRTKITAELNPMTSDERRAIHNALANEDHIKTISIGAGKDRHVTIQYVNIAPDGTVQPVEAPAEEDVVEPEKKDIDDTFKSKEDELLNGEAKAEEAQPEEEKPADDSPFEKPGNDESGKL
jgi:spoIIIJ-associated protein